MGLDRDRQMMTRLCPKCQQDVPLDQYYTRIVKKLRQYQPYCIPCTKATASAHRVENRDDHLAYQRTYNRKYRARPPTEEQRLERNAAQLRRYHATKLTRPKHILTEEQRLANNAAERRRYHLRKLKKEKSNDT